MGMNFAPNIALMSFGEIEKEVEIEKEAENE